MSIRVLEPQVATKIAAGEVIERPASVIKELVENSLDAGATQVTVEVRGGGIQLMRVADDGCGIPSDEVDLAFRRHATSKITGLADLQSVATLGFRGEALPSIVSVAEVTLITRTKSEIVGSYANLKGGIMVEQGRRGCPHGTTITVRNLFSALPARLKFQKSSATEVGHISTLVMQYALAYPAVKFTLLVDGRDVFHTSGSGKLHDGLIQVYGLEIAKQMIEVDQRSRQGDGGGRVWGFVSPPSVNRTNRNYMSLFVNRRWVQSRRITFATEEAYRGTLPVGRHPIVVLNLELSSLDVDVNVHPTKSEVRFVREDEAFDAVYRSVRSVLMASAPVPAMHVPGNSRQPLPPGSASTSASFDIGGWTAVSSGTNGEVFPERKTVSSSLPVLRVMGQIAGTYIIAEGPDGMYLIDQHTAHERVLFEKFQQQLQDNKVESQGLLEPLSVELTPSQEERLQSELPALTKGGFEIEPFGEHACIVRAIPRLLSDPDPAEALVAILDDLSDGSTAMDWTEKLAMSLACHGAVRAGQALSVEEMRELIRQLEKATLPRTCPHGRPTMIHLSASQLEKEFGRR